MPIEEGLVLHDDALHFRLIGSVQLNYIQTIRNIADVGLGLIGN